MEKVKDPACDQANDLIDFLYGELDEIQAQKFQGHMGSCNSCSAEFSAFKGIRSSMLTWRDESLGRISAPALQQRLPSAIPIAPEKPSALAALREFLNLSPIWMKGALAFATLLFLVFSGLALARLRDTPPVSLASNANGSEKQAYSAEQIDALVKQRVQEEIQRLRISSPQPAIEQVAVKNPAGRIPSQGPVPRLKELASGVPARRPLSKVEREQLAADLRLVSLNNESELDLLDDRMNQ